LRKLDSGRDIQKEKDLSHDVDGKLFHEIDAFDFFLDIEKATRLLLGKRRDMDSSNICV
jgi:hypothetical protein